MQLLLRRAPLYAATCFVAIAVQTAVAVLSHGDNLAVTFVSCITIPIAEMIVLVNAGADAGGWVADMGLRWERIVERAWAVILIDLAIGITQSAGVAYATVGDVGLRLQGLFILLMSTMLVYAEPYAALEQDISQITLVPFSLIRSMMLAWVNFPRILVFFTIVLASNIGYKLLTAVQAQPAGLSSAIQMAYNTVISMVLSALFAAAYLDTVAQEKETVL